MNMVHCLSCVLLSAGLIFPSGLMAQTDPPTENRDRKVLRQRMEVLAVGFMTEELELDAETAQVFWPIFNAHKEKMWALKDRKDEARIAMAFFDDQDLTAFNELLAERESVELEEASLRAGFLREMAAVFDPQFAIRCIDAQKAFEREMRVRFQERMSKEDRRALGKMGRGPGRQKPR